MDPILLIDFGSTYTKVAAVCGESREILGTAQSFTTVETDIGAGLKDALSELLKQTGELRFKKRLACSSAAGGLRMAVSGLVPELTAEAARLASLGAGAKVQRVFSFELTDEDIAEIASVKPDIFLLTGGTDGGNSKCILRNAEALKNCPGDFPVLIAGNRAASAECAEILGERGIRLPNVMPKFGELNISPIQEKIREIFLSRIVEAKGLSRQAELLSGILMPTPSAVLRALTLLADGTENERGLGELVAVDLGGATTDVYSIAAGGPRNDQTVQKGLPEPRVKRTVEGDIGMRYSAGGVLEAVGADALAEVSGLEPLRVASLVRLITQSPGALPETPEMEALDFALASGAVKTAMKRHAGRLEELYTPAGQVFLQTGKDLRDVSAVIATGGALIRAKRGIEAANSARFEESDPFSLRPERPRVLLDRSYILAAMGLLAEEDPECALTIMKRELL